MFSSIMKFGVPLTTLQITSLNQAKSMMSVAFLVSFSIVHLHLVQKAALSGKITCQTDILMA